MTLYLIVRTHQPGSDVQGPPKGRDGGTAGKTNSNKTEIIDSLMHDDTDDEDA